MPSRALSSRSFSKFTPKRGHSLPEVCGQLLKNSSVIHGPSVNHTVAIFAFKTLLIARKIRHFPGFLCGEIDWMGLFGAEKRPLGDRTRF
jgi:hypothetical protein